MEADAVVDVEVAALFQHKVNKKAKQKRKI